ncbi:MAG: glycosyl transferase family 2, partial [Bacteroidota bacterium]|nr:glycosyl transferase family 2 [Bacteroidota bacterium]
LFLIITYPINLFIITKPFKLLSNTFSILIGKKTWIGYCTTKGNKSEHSPTIRKGILNPTDALENKNISEDTIDRLNLLYARNYSLKNDLDIIIKKYRELGR